MEKKGFFSKSIPFLQAHIPQILFILGVIVYLSTRLIRLPDFPIYFFTDEAIQTQSAADLIANDFRSPDGILLPTYFENGGQFNLSLSVYIQVLPTLLFGKSIWVTRGVSVMATFCAVIFIALILKQAIKMPNWWLTPVILATIPTWFLHSRTAFETVLMTAMYSGFLYFYLRYRQDHPQALFAALTFGALAFYAYSPGQVIVVVTGLLLLIADWRYHWQHRKTALIGLGMLVVFAVPYIRFRILNANETFQHLMKLNTYWIKPIPLYQKIWIYFTRYLKGLNPLFWLWPNPSFLEQTWPQIKLPAWLFSTQYDLIRHTMKGYGHLLWLTFPFWEVGLVRCIRRFRASPAHRTLLLAALAAPTGAAIVDWGITRGMVFVIPSVLFIALGVEVSIAWLKDNFPKFRTGLAAGAVFLFFTGASIWMLADSLQNGPTWYENYSLDGLQYGARQVFTRAAEIAQSEPETRVLVSSTWTNGATVLMRYFTNDLPNVRMGNINAFTSQLQPLDHNTLFIMTEADMTLVNESNKFTNLEVEETIPYPNGKTGFYFVRLEYVEGIEAILEAERTTRQTLHAADLTINGQTVEVQYPTLDMNGIQHAFDGDPTTLIRTLEANPLRLILTFEKPTEVHAVSLVLGGNPFKITLTGYSGEGELDERVKEFERSPVTHEERIAFTKPMTADQIIIEILNPHDGEISHIHLWEVILE